MTDDLHDDDLNETPDDGLDPVEDDLADDAPQLAHSGFVVVCGKPNVGKSTLMNQILGEKIAIVSPKPQTTRLRQFGIYTRPDVQAIFVDTPGLHQPRHELGEYMVQVALDAIHDAEVILFVVDLSSAPDEDDQRVAAIIGEARAAAFKAGTVIPVVMALNKIDRTAAKNVLPHSEAYQALIPDALWTAISAVAGRGVGEVLDHIIERLPAGPQYYPDDQLSDTPVREIVAEIVREKVLLNLAQEVPHAVAVEVDEYTERSASLTYIRLTIYVERDSQKGILIGGGGGMLRTIAASAREDIETLIGTKVYLEPWVKVLKNWRRDPNFLRRLGYRVKKS
ncbi:MAG: GTPase Era [Anaerolineales bacterium]|nr:GTPase Era [Anaerolineales bacterium]